MAIPEQYGGVGLVIVVVRREPDPHGGRTLLVVEDGMHGFERGRNLVKMGIHAQDPSELSITVAYPK